MKKITATNPAVKPTLTKEQEEQLRAEHSFYWAQFQQMEERAAKWMAASGKRKLAAWVLGLVAGISTGYAGASLLGYLVVGSLMLTGSAFLASLIYVVGLVLTIYAGMRAFFAGFNYVLSNDCDRHMAAVESGLKKVGSWFSFGKAEPQAAS